LAVDVENFAARDISIDIADHYFAPQEVAALRGVKARGMGVSLPLDRFSFHFADDRSVDLGINSELGDDSSRWQLWRFRPTSEHLLAVCVEKIDAQSAKPLVRETAPVVSERILAPGLLRTSSRGVGCTLTGESAESSLAASQA
jgi:4'-phosphopantetheinyl transferase